MDDSYQLDDPDHAYMSDEDIDQDINFNDLMHDRPSIQWLLAHSQNSKPAVVPPPVKAEEQKIIQLPLKESDLTEENSVCKICYKHAINAFNCNNQKCSILMCGRCIEQGISKTDNRCPFCRVEPFQPRISPYRDAINKSEWKCRLCTKSYILLEEENHYKSECSYFHQIECLYCKEKLDKDQIVKHTKEQHFDKMDQIIAEMYKYPPPVYDPRELVNSKKDYLNSIHKCPKLGTTGKFYCGAKLDPPKCYCCNGYCGPTNGENCSECMKLDILRLRLPKGYLVNSEGHVCWKVGTNFMCNTMNYYHEGICKEGSPCRPCHNMTQNIQRYAHLL